MGIKILTNLGTFLKLSLINRSIETQINSLLNSPLLNSLEKKLYQAYHCFFHNLQWHGVKAVGFLQAYLK